METSLEYLKNCSYKTLQQIAKSLKLPSNFRKVCLVELIHVKTTKTEAEVTTLINVIKKQRAEAAKTRRSKQRVKRKVQAAEISSTSNICSPPLVETPKRLSSILARCSPELRIVKCNPYRSLWKPSFRSETHYRSSLKNFLTNRDNLNVIKHAAKCNEPNVLNEFLVPKESSQGVIKFYSSTSDGDHDTLLAPCSSQNSREDSASLCPSLNSYWDNILRSYNFETPVQSYNKLAANKAVETDMNDPESKLKRTVIKVVGVSGHHRINVTAYVTRNINDTLDNASANGEARVETLEIGTSSPAASRRQRIISGRYSLNNPDASPINQNTSISPSEYINNEFKPLNSPFNQNFQDMTVRDMLNANISSTVANMLNNDHSSIDIDIPMLIDIVGQVPDYGSQVDVIEQRDEAMAHGDDVIEQMDYLAGQRVNAANQSALAEATAYQNNISSLIDVECLPRIVDTFSNFVRNEPVQPTYGNTNEDRGQPLMTHELQPACVDNTSLLENIFNFKNSFIINEPMLSVTTTSNTLCVYSTPVISTAVAHPSAPVYKEGMVARYQQADMHQYNTGINHMPIIHDYISVAEENTDVVDDNRTDEVMDESKSSLNSLRSQELGANVTIPEMVEDALELITHDGNYMQRINMEFNMQCILCNWAGPKGMLEYHVRQDHWSLIHKQVKNEWNITYTLASLTTGQWFNRVMEYKGKLYVLSAKYKDPERLMACFHVLRAEDKQKPIQGKLTIYNKVNGEPFSWEGDIDELPEMAPINFEDNSVHLNIPLSYLDVLPNIANMTLRDRNLVQKTTNKVIVSQSAMNDIHIIFFLSLKE